MAETISNKKENKKNPEKEMTFWEHLEELRWLLNSDNSISCSSIPEPEDHL